MSEPDSEQVGIYLAGPVEHDDDPRTWRDELKDRFPDVNWIDPMDWQDDWDEDPRAVIQRELAAVEQNAVLVCNVGSEAPETVGTHHEISHALACGNEHIAVVPEGDVAGFVRHRDIPIFDDVEDAVEVLWTAPTLQTGAVR
jgi:hypothetical protein